MCVGVSFTPKEVGEHLVNVFKGGAHIPNSPFRISVSPAEIGDASRVRVWGPGTSRAVANQVATFNIDMSDAGKKHQQLFYHTNTYHSRFLLNYRTSIC